MVVSICAEGPGRLSLRAPLPGEIPIRIMVPAGSEVLPVNGLGPHVFIPSPGDQLQRHAWSPLQILRAAHAKRDGFRIV